MVGYSNEEGHMKKLKVLQKITNAGLVAVIRADSKHQAMKIAEACVEGGITAIEITFTVNRAAEVIEELSSSDYFSNVVIGAGTVLDVTTARIAMLAGAQFIVSPSFDTDTAKLCNVYQIPYLPGCMTITEMKRALEAGVDIVKLFPGSSTGPEFIKAVKGPLPQANMMPTGGVNLDNVESWIKNGAVAVGVGGNLLAPAKTGEYDEISKVANIYRHKIERAREGSV